MPKMKPAHLRILLIVMLVLLNMAVRLTGAWRPLEHLDDITFPDDAFLSLQIARSIGHGLGPWCGSGYTNGFQPLYVLLMAPVYAVSADPYYQPLRVALNMLSLCDSLALALMLIFVARYVKQPLALAAMGLAWTFNSILFASALNGLETSLALACLAGTWLWFDRMEAETSAAKEWFQSLVLGGLFGLAVLARIDSLIFGPVLALSAWRWQRHDKMRCLARISVGAAVGFALVYGPWLVWSYHYTGRLFPVSGRAVRQLSMALDPRLEHALIAPFMFKRVFWACYLYNQRQILWVVLLLLLFIVQLRHAKMPMLPSLGRALRPIAGLWLLLALLAVAYATYIYTWWFYNRYFLPFVLPLLSSLALLAGAVLDRIPRPVARRWFGGAMLAGIATLGVTDPHFRVNFAAYPENEAGYFLKVGRWMQRELPTGTILGGTQTGAIGYFGDHLRVINLDGVVNPAAYEAIRNRRLGDYMAEQKIELLLDWPGQLALVQYGSARGRRPMLSEIGEVPETRAWKQRYVLYRVSYSQGYAP